MTKADSIEVADIERQVDLDNGSLTVCYQTVSDAGGAERRIKLMIQTDASVGIVTLSEDAAEEWSEAIAAVLAAE